jgi:hypothetical protein
MFHENGTWKEFGYQRSSRHTMFPFWLFAVTWAFLSYAIAAAVLWMLPSFGPASTVAAAATAASSYGPYSQSEYSDSEEEEEEEATPVSAYVEPPRRGRGRPRKSEVKKPREGYYVIDPQSLEGGLRKYVYYGSERPGED